MRRVNLALAYVTIDPQVQFLGKESGYIILGTSRRSRRDPLRPRLVQPIDRELHDSVLWCVRDELTGDRSQVLADQIVLHRQMLRGLLVWMIIILIITLIHLFRLMIQH